jgi:hypothetical protein
MFSRATASRTPLVARGLGEEQAGHLRPVVCGVEDDHLLAV